MNGGQIVERPPICLVLSTGRCGSTLLSSIVRLHPAVLSISELFSGLRDHDLTEREIEGAEFWDMLRTPCKTDIAVLRCQVKPDEMLYPAFDPRLGANRFSWRTGLPPIMQVCIPHLTEFPDSMYEALEAVAIGQPRRLLSEHLWWLFSMFAAGRQPMVVVERSGGSLSYAGSLLKLFPQAKLVHLFRDGRECALSMSQHGRFRFAMIRAILSARYGYDPYLADTPSDPPSGTPSHTFSGTPSHTPSGTPSHTFSGGRRDVAGSSGSDNGYELSDLFPERITPLSYDQFEVPLRRYGAMWSKMVVEGLGAIADWPRVLTLDYAELVANPAGSIGTLLEFLELARSAALEKRMASIVRPGINVRNDVGERQWSELTQSCRVGMNRLYGRNNWKLSRRRHASSGGPP
jgi:hypothetical protein